MSRERWWLDLARAAGGAGRCECAGGRRRLVRFSSTPAAHGVAERSHVHSNLEVICSIGANCRQPDIA